MGGFVSCELRSVRPSAVSGDCPGTARCAALKPDALRTACVQVLAFALGLWREPPRSESARLGFFISISCPRGAPPICGGTRQNRSRSFNEEHGIVFIHGRPLPATAMPARLNSAM